MDNLIFKNVGSGGEPPPFSFIVGCAMGTTTLYIYTSDYFFKSGPHLVLNLLTLKKTGIHKNGILSNSPEYDGTVPDFSPRFPRPETPKKMSQILLLYPIFTTFD